MGSPNRLVASCDAYFLGAGGFEICDAAVRKKFLLDSGILFAISPRQKLRTMIFGGLAVREICTADDAVPI